jgi:hypothetical protein
LKKEEELQSTLKMLSEELSKRNILTLYCRKCKRKSKVKVEKETILKSGAKAVIGYCLVCKTKITQFVKK